MYGLDLFSGIGGLSVALEPWVKTVAYCEQNSYAQGVLLSRMVDGSIACAPIWDDVTTLNGSFLPKVDIIFGGFPCQDISVAGNGLGLEGKRSGLFFEICRLIDECKPTFIFLENVPAIRTRGLSTVIQELSSRGFHCRWTCLSAEEIGANHKRERWFCLAANTERLELWEQQGRRSGTSGKSTPESAEYGSNAGWTTEPFVRGADDGLPFEMDRSRCLGNAVVPLQAQEAFKELMGLKESENS